MNSNHSNWMEIGSGLHLEFPGGIYHVMGRGNEREPILLLGIWVASTFGNCLTLTIRSPSVALHPASRRRSYSQLQAGERLPEADLHRSVRVRSWAH